MLTVLGRRGRLLPFSYLKPWMLAVQSQSPDPLLGSIVRPALDAMPATLFCAPNSCTKYVQATAVRCSRTLSAPPVAVQRTHSFCSAVRPPKPTTAATPRRASVAPSAAAATMPQVRGCPSAARAHHP